MSVLSNYGGYMDIISTADLRKKEIINLCDGARLGYACDFEFDKCSAQITGLIIEIDSGFLGLGADRGEVIPWCKVECIGEDTILVNLTSNEMSNLCRKRKKKPFDFK